MKTNINIAIDGPAGAGKSSVARECAKQLGYIYVDTGALYRSIALFALENSVDTHSEEAVSAILSGLQLELAYSDGKQCVILGGEDVSEKIRSNEVSMNASVVSAYPAVRSFLLGLQRDIAAKNNIIMDGRDIGTVILPNAQLKIFLTASVDKRAERRYKELCAKGMKPDFDKLCEEIKQRDYNDEHRETAPLKCADDAVLLDTSDMNFNEVVETILSMISEI